jgi:lipid II isoglutaminyl synthase (glutamine-hydrolysing)
MVERGQRSLRLAHLYPTLMNLYGDRGNIFCLQHRCAARGIELLVDEIGIDDGLSAGGYDLIFMGGGQDREQRRIGADLVELKGEPIKRAVEAGMPVLTVCGGYQMMGRSYCAADGDRLQGLAVFPMDTVHPGDAVPRCIGNIAIEWERGVLVGFENHGGRSYLDAEAAALGTVGSGFGNNGEDRTEGCRYKNAIGTYLHGSLLPKNPGLADMLIGIALERKYGSAELAPLDDSLETAAHRTAQLVAQREADSRAKGVARVPRVVRRVTGRFS